MKTRIHVNQHNIRSNKTKGTNLPVITVKQGKMNTYCNEVEILGPSRIIYGGDGHDANRTSTSDSFRGLYTVSNIIKSSSASGENTAFNAFGDMDVNLLKVTPPTVMKLANTQVVNN